MPEGRVGKSATLYLAVCTMDSINTMRMIRLGGTCFDSTATFTDSLLTYFFDK